jgi:cytochrome P450
MEREARRPEAFRGREVARGAKVAPSPRDSCPHERIWRDPDGFDPDRWATEEEPTCGRDAFVPFSQGARVCPGAGFARLEAPPSLARLLRRFRFEVIEGLVATAPSSCGGATACGSG